MGHAASYMSMGRAGASRGVTQGSQVTAGVARGSVRWLRRAHCAGRSRAADLSLGVMIDAARVLERAPEGGTVTDARSPGALLDPSALLGPGALLGGRYRIGRFIAAGGMGEVYEARDELLRETIAVKLLRQDLLRKTGAQERFADEIRMARKVTHVNVCRVYEVGIDGARVLHDGAARRRDARGAAARGRRDVARGDPADRAAGAGGHRRGARGRCRACRSQTIECPAGRQGPGRGDGLRTRTALLRDARVSLRDGTWSARRRTWLRNRSPAAWCSTALTCSRSA